MEMVATQQQQPAGLWVDGKIVPWDQIERLLKDFVGEDCSQTFLRILQTQKDLLTLIEESALITEPTYADDVRIGLNRMGACDNNPVLSAINDEFCKIMD